MRIDLSRHAATKAITVIALLFLVPAFIPNAEAAIDKCLNYGHDCFWWSWVKIDVTGTSWSITQLPRPDQTNATGYFPGGLGWYRKTFTLPAWMKHKRISVDFDGVFDNSYVYLNGHLVGNHPYGYTGYSYDVTNLVHTDGHIGEVVLKNPTAPPILFQSVKQWLESCTYTPAMQGSKPIPVKIIQPFNFTLRQ